MRQLTWNGHRFNTVKDVEQAITAHVMNALKGPVPHPNDLTVVVRDPRRPEGEREKLTVKVAVFVTAGS